MSNENEKWLTAQLNERSAIINGALDGTVVIDDASEVCAPEASPALSVLVVDDDLDVAETIAELLSGMNVQVASSAEAALEKMELTALDVILSDLRMPDVDGPGNFKTAQERCPRLPGTVRIYHRRQPQRGSQVPARNECAGG